MGEKNNIGKMYEIITQTDWLELAKSIGKTTVANSVERTASFVLIGLSQSHAKDQTVQSNRSNLRRKF